MSTQTIIERGKQLLSNAEKATAGGCEDMARRELRELRRLLAHELREPKKK